MRISLGVLLACGLAAGWSLAGVVPAGLVEQCRRDVVTQPFKLLREVEVSDGHWFFLPQLWGDFNLLLDLELGAGVEVDVLLRQVEPRFVDEVQEPFSGRFSVLRISSEGDGPGWRSREAALFGPAGGGVGVASGRPATVWIEARGKTLTANVGGKRQPELEADDVYGMLTLVARGGKAVIHNLEIQTAPIEGVWRWHSLTWICAGGVTALVLAAVVALLSRRRQFIVAGAALFGVAAALTHGVEMRLMFPSIAGMSSLLACATLVAAALAALRGRALCVGVVAVSVAVAAQLVWPQPLRARLVRALGLSESPQIDATFGPDAGEQLSKALGQLVRMPNGIVSREQSDARAKRVFLLGGELLYNRAEPGEHIGLQLGSILRGAVSPGSDALSLPTVDGFSAQQWRLFDQFYQCFEPDVVVFGVGATEADAERAGGAPRTTPATLRATLAAVRADCRERGRGLVFFLDVGTPRALREAVVLAAGGEVPIVELFEHIPRRELAQRLFDTVQPLLR